MKRIYRWHTLMATKTNKATSRRCILCLMSGEIKLYRWRKNSLLSQCLATFVPILQSWLIWDINRPNIASFSKERSLFTMPWSFGLTVLSQQSPKTFQRVRRLSRVDESHFQKFAIFLRKFVIKSPPKQAFWTSWWLQNSEEKWQKSTKE